MYNTDLDLITKARLQRTQNVALAQRHRPGPLALWWQRVASELAQKLHH